MGDRIVSLEEDSGRYHISVATLTDIVKREDKEYLQSFEGAAGLAGRLESSLETGLNADEAADGYNSRIAVYVQFYPCFDICGVIENDLDWLIEVLEVFGVCNLGSIERSGFLAFFGVTFFFF